MSDSIQNHIDLDNTVAEMHDELLRMVDADEAGDIDAAVEYYEKVRTHMEAVRVYLSQQTT